MKMTDNIKIKRAISELRNGRFVLIHDNKFRENETDLMVAAEFITPEHISKMRSDGGGLICVSIDKELAKKINLPFMADVLKISSYKYTLLNYTAPYDIPYDEKSSFSISVNHRDTFTGITDNDRALTIRKLAEFFKGNPTEKKFGKDFRSPGHVQLLISSGIENRGGHTELATTLLRIANLTPVACICEMLDSKTHNALPVEDVRRYADLHDMTLLEGGEIKNFYMHIK